MKNLAKIISFAALSFMVLAGCNKPEELAVSKKEDLSKLNPEKQIVNIASKEEYLKMEANERYVVDMLNAAINGLKGLYLNGQNKDYEAILSVSKAGKNLKFDFVGIGLTEKSPTNARTERIEGSCSACGFSSGVSCAKKLLADVDKYGSLNVKVVKAGDCYNISW